MCYPSCPQGEPFLPASRLVSSLFLKTSSPLGGKFPLPSPQRPPRPPRIPAAAPLLTRCVGMTYVSVTLVRGSVRSMPWSFFCPGHLTKYLVYSKCSPQTRTKWISPRWVPESINEWTSKWIHVANGGMDRVLLGHGNRSGFCSSHQEPHSRCAWAGPEAWAGRPVQRRYLWRRSGEERAKQESRNSGAKAGKGARDLMGCDERLALFHTKATKNWG